MQDRRVGLHRLGDVDDVRQHLVVDLDQRQRLLGDRLRHRGDGGNRMALVERLLARHDVARDVAHVHLHLAGRHDQVGLVGEVLGRDHRLHAGQRLGLRGVDRLDDGVGVRAAQHLADQLAGQVEVGAEAGAAGHLVGAVGTIGTRADPLVLAGGVLERGSSGGLPHFGGHFEDRGDDLVVTRAAAEVAGQPVADLGLGRVRVLRRAAPWRRPGSPACRCRTAARPSRRTSSAADAACRRRPCPRWSRSSRPRPRARAPGRSRPAGR